jgi:hypothetical protein
MDTNDSLPAVLSSEDLVQYDVTRLDRIRRSPTRSLNAVYDSFDLVGGVPRLALWADRNYGEFVTKVFARTIQSSAAVEHGGNINITTVIPRTAIDGPAPGDDSVVDEQ